MSTKKPVIRIVKRQDIQAESEETTASDLNDASNTAATSTSVHDWVRSFKSERRIEPRVTFSDLFRKTNGEEPQSLTNQPLSTSTDPVSDED